MLDLRDRPEAKVALLLDLHEVEHHEDTRFALSLDHYLESWLGSQPREVFPLPGARLLILAPDDARGALETGAAALIHVLRHHGFGTAHAGFFDLKTGAAGLLEEVLPGAEPGRARGSPPARPVSSATLGRMLEVERSLRGADVEALLREQPVWSFATEPPSTLLTELAISLEELESRLEVELRRNDWLRHEIAAMLDRGMLRHIARDRWLSGRRFGIDLHVSTVLGDEFTAMIRPIPPEVRRTLVAELASWELGLSGDRFALAAERLADLGFAVAVDRVPLEALATLDLAGVEPAFVKAAWTAGAGAAGAGERLRAAVERFGPDRLVLWRCTSPAALEVGRAAGLTLFQGHAADAAAEAAVLPAEPPEGSRGRDRGVETAADGQEAVDQAAPAAAPGLLTRLFGHDD
ncbi:hypothetical protein DEW08_11170 [Azospirillum thermophilum]|uniref:EAL domain-containing protein n=1 Tax=Azospirillum thermophilum TaxID=2202148 RepID=A0A2S2CQC1_9PROT|nr:hypothetical protein DEW08_11170 [Azospirillum thermophilum]